MPPTPYPSPLPYNSLSFSHPFFLYFHYNTQVKLVLAAAMWNRPHIIVLDEPTNYLDREALGALTQAIKGFHGGVVIISHNSEFTDALCTENWIVSNGNCVVEGEAEETALKAAAAAGNKIRKSKSAPILTYVLYR